MKKKTNISKWNKIGLCNRDLRAIYQTLRMKAKTILKQKHEKEYKCILKRLLDEKYKEIKGIIDED